VRVLLAAVTGPVLASYAATVALVALLSVTAGAEWSLAGTLRAAVPFWLAAHQVPLSITAPGAAAAPFGVLPLLPTVGLAVLVARSAGGAAVRLGWYEPVRLGLLAAVFGGVHGGLGLLVAVLAPSSRIAAAPAHALLGCAVISAMAATCGGMRAARLDTVASPLLPPWAVRGVRAGLAGLAALLAAGALCTFGGLLLSAATAHEVLAGWGGAIGGQFGVTALSIAYLPNAAVAALSWTSGPGLSVGAVSVTPFSTTAGPLPAVPLLAALPEPGPAPWRVLVFALPLLAGVLVARHCRRIPGDPTDRLHAVVTAGAVASSGCFVLAILAGGRLGGGAFDPVRIPPASLAIAVFVWLVLPAGLIVGLADRSTRGPGVLADAVPEPDPELERYAEVELGAEPVLDVTPKQRAESGSDVAPEAAAGPGDRDDRRKWRRRFQVWNCGRHFR